MAIVYPIPSDLTRRLTLDAIANVEFWEDFKAIENYWEKVRSKSQVGEAPTKDMTIIVRDFLISNGIDPNAYEVGSFTMNLRAKAREEFGYV